MATPPDNETTRADVLLREALTILGPLTRAMVAHGVTYPVFAAALKRVFLEAARQELVKDQKRVTDSALSLLSGVHRKDVRVMADEDLADATKRQRARSLASEIVTKWLTDEAYQDPDGRPRRLRLRAKEGEASFEALSQSISKDFHSRSVLDELVRLGLAETDAETVGLTSELFLPSTGFVDRAFYFGQNVRDHIAACAANLEERYDDAPFLEYAIYAEQLSAESTHQLHLKARQLWLRAHRQIVNEAVALEEKDRALPVEDRQHRMRFGVFFYEENMSQQAAKNVDAGNAE